MKQDTYKEKRDSMKKKFILLMLACLVMTSACVYAKGHPNPQPNKGGHIAIRAHSHQPPPPNMRHPAPAIHHHPAPPPPHYNWWSRGPGCSHFFPFWCGCNGGRFSLNISI